MNVKPGDVAYITKSPLAPCNVGAAVKVIEPFEHPIEGVAAWVISTIGDAPLRGIGLVDREPLSSTEGIIRDAWLSLEPPTATVAASTQQNSEAAS